MILFLTSSLASFLAEKNEDKCVRLSRKCLRNCFAEWFVAMHCVMHTVEFIARQIK